MIDLTVQEEAVVRKFSRDQVDLPYYYDALVRADVAISRDFEAFLILAPTELKTSAIEWITQVSELTQDRKVRNDLLKLVITKELERTALTLGAYEDLLGEFNKFRQNFQTDTRFAAIPEVVRFLNDLQIVIDEQVAGQQSAFYDDTVARLVQAREQNAGLSNDRVEQLQSWRTVLSSYVRQSAG